jgi:hypothetical protein
MSFLFASQNLPFTIALMIMIVIAIMEGTTLFLGAGITNVFDNLVPAIDLDGLDTPELSAQSGMTRFLAWLRIGKVPILITLILFLTIFGLLGLIFQGVLGRTVGFYLPSFLAVVPVFLVTLPILRASHGAVAKIIPRDETYAVSEDTFIGRIAVITAGTATAILAAEARLQDEHGRDHYIMVKPDDPEETFTRGTSVLIVSQDGSYFLAISNPNPNLIDP